MGKMLIMDRQTSNHVIGHMMSANIFSKIYIIDFLQQTDNFFRYKVIVS